MVILGDIETSDPVNYQFILATVVEGQSEPGLYITAERNLPDQGQQADYDMRLVMRDGAQLIGTSARWEDLEMFATEALDIVVKVLNLEDEEIKKIM